MRFLSRCVVGAAALLLVAGNAQAGETACAAERKVDQRTPADDTDTADPKGVAVARVGFNGQQIAGCLADPSAIAGAVVVDTRHSGVLSRIRIPGALHMLPEQIPDSATVSRDQQILLVGTGKDTSGLIANCIRLQGQGYAGVRVLADGVRAWQSTDNPLQGISNAPIELSFLSASELQRLVVSPRPNIVIADVDSTPRDLAPVSRRILRNESRTEGARRATREMLRDGYLKGVDPVVVVLRNRDDAAAWSTAWHAATGTYPFFYVGSDADYRRELDRSELIAADRDKPLPGPCDR